MENKRKQVLARLYALANTPGAYSETAKQAICMLVEDEKEIRALKERNAALSSPLKPGDVCFYSYGEDNKSIAIVKIVKILNDPRGVAEIKFRKVIVDDTGNGIFNYLYKSGKTMNASFKYLTAVHKVSH